MAFTRFKSNLFLLSIFTLAILVRSRLNLPTSDHHDIQKRYMFAENSISDNKTQTTIAIAPSSLQAYNSQAQSPVSSPRKLKKNKGKTRQWILGILGGVLAGSGSGLVFSLLFKFIMFLIRKRKEDKSLRIFSPMIKNPEDLAFLQNPNGLATLDIIGRGGCGEVYRAVLPGSNGKEIAVKKIVQITNVEEENNAKVINKKMKQIRSEIQTVGQIRHKNLLALWAHMPRPDCHYLIFEYMKNGSLQDYLFEVARGKKELNWLARYKIALGVASGLEYLHTYHKPRIIHRDLKPANILLDDEMEARITDFGLAQSMPDSHTHVSTSNVAGTVGYIAPEYYQTFQFTDKCDVYSFGVVLGSLVMGKLPSDEFFQYTEEVSSVKWMRNVMSSEDPKKAIDSNLLGLGYEEQMLLVLKIACFCTMDDPKERPDSKDARCMLAQIIH